MKMKKNLVLSLTAVLSVSTVLAACSGGDTETSKPAEKKEEVKQVLNLLSSSEIPSMDITKATDSVSFDIMSNVFEGLYRLGKDGVTAEPAMAESVEISEDGKTYTFKIREDAKWSNGEPVTAQDFVYSYQRTLNKDAGASYAFMLYYLENANEINAGKAKPETLGAKAVDDKTLELKLTAPTPFFLSLTTFPTFFPLNEKFVKEQGDNFAKEPENLVYNGPFALTEWKHEQSYKITKNPTYWDKDNVKLEEVNFSIVKDSQTGLNLYNTDSVDRAGLDAQTIDQYRESEDFGTAETPVVFFIRMNQQNKVLANVNARKAISQGFDKEALVSEFLNNGSVAANSIVPKNFAKGPEGTAGVDFREENGEFLKFDAAAAKESWEKAKKELGIKEATIEFLNYDDDNAKRMGEYIQAQLEENLPGLKVTIKAQPFKQKLELEDKGEYDLSFAGWGPDYLDAMTFIDMWTSDSPFNQMKYSNKEFDKIVADAKDSLAVDPAKRWEAMKEAEKILFEDAAFAPLYQRARAFVMKDYVKDFVLHPVGGELGLKYTYIEK